MYKGKSLLKTHSKYSLTIPHFNEGLPFSTEVIYTRKSKQTEDKFRKREP